MLSLLLKKPQYTDLIASYVISRKLRNWEDAMEAREQCKNLDPIESGYWEYMVHVLGGVPPSDPSQTV